MHQFPKFTPAWNSTCFGQFLCPSSEVYSMYTWHWYMSYRFVDSFWWSCSKAVYKPVWHIPVPSVQWINSWWWTEELPKTCRVSCRGKFGKLVHLVGFIIKKLVTMHGHVNVKKKTWQVFCTVLPGVHPRRIISVRNGKNLELSHKYCILWAFKNTYFFKSSSVCDKREPHLKQMMFRSFGIAWWKCFTEL